jgi:hypothetical protein
MTYWLANISTLHAENDIQKQDSKNVCCIIINMLGIEFLRLCPSSSILNEHNLLETGFVSIIKGKDREASAQSFPVQRANYNHWTTKVSHLYLYIHLRSGFVNGR